jgi:hypothetical protein
MLSRCATGTPGAAVRRKPSSTLYQCVSFGRLNLATAFYRRCSHTHAHTRVPGCLRVGSPSQPGMRIKGAQHTASSALLSLLLPLLCSCSFTSRQHQLLKHAKRAAHSRTHTQYESQPCPRHTFTTPPLQSITHKQPNHDRSSCPAHVVARAAARAWHTGLCCFHCAF